MATSQTAVSYGRGASVDLGTSSQHAQAFENLAKKLHRLESKLGMLIVAHLQVLCTNHTPNHADVEPSK